MIDEGVCNVISAALVFSGIVSLFFIPYYGGNAVILAVSCFVMAFAFFIYPPDRFGI
jgi:hypothetical protein